MPSNCHYKKYLPDNPPELHPTEISSQACIVPSDGSEGKLFLKLINRHYVYNGRQSTSVFDLDHLEQDVVKLFSGLEIHLLKIFFKEASKYKYVKYSVNTYVSSIYSPGCAIDLSAIAQELPSDYKVTIVILYSDDL